MIRKRTTKGQSLAEFGLILPLILLLVFGFLDMGRAVYYYSAIGNAAREGARYASVRPLDLQTAGSTDIDDVRTVVQDYAVSVGLDADKITFPAAPTEDYVTVKIVYDFVPITPFVNTLTLNAETTMLLAPIARQ